MIVNIPMTGKLSTPRYNPSEVQGQYALLLAKYGDFFRQACTLNNIPDYLLAGIVLSENYQIVADSVHRNSSRIQDAVGLGQHKMYSATDVVSRAKTKHLLTEDKRAVLRKMLGERLAYIEKHVGTTEPVITQADLKDPEFNLMLTGLYLSQLVGQSTENGVYRIDKVAYRYNQGYFAKLPALSATADQLLAGLSGEGRLYVLRLVGHGGLLAALT